MAVNANNYNYVTGYFNCGSVGTKYQPFGYSYTSQANWAISFESVRMSGSGDLASNLDSDTDNWRVGIDSSGHPFIYWSRSSTMRTTKTFTNLTVSWNTWFSISFVIQTNQGSPVIKCTLNGSTGTVTVTGRWNVNYTRSLRVGSSVTTLRGVTTVKGYAYASDTLYTATFNPDALSVGATSMSTDGYTFTISSAVQNYTLKYTISYNANGGASTPATQTVTAGNSVNLAAAITKAQTSAAATLTHTFNSNGGNTPSPSTKTTTKTTYTPWSFSKWALNGTGGTQYSAGASYTPTATVTFYAIFTAGTATYGYSQLGTLPTATRTSGTATATRTVTYAPNGGSVSPTSATSTAKVTYTYALDGWYTAASGGTKISTSTAPTAGTTYYAHWNTTTTTGAYSTVTPPTPSRSSTSATSALTHTFNSNGGNTPSPATKTTTKTTTTYYTFNKWWNGTTSYAAGTAFTPSGNITLTACWTTTTGTSYSTLGTLPTATKNSSTSTATRTVTFNANGGSVTPTSTKTTSTTTLSYTLNGWYTASSGGTKITTATNPSSGTTYYAHWDTSTATSGFGSVALPTPTWAIHKPTGWYTATTGGTKRGDAGASYSPTGNETLYAQWYSAANINLNGTWKAGNSVHVNVNGTWKTATAIWVNDNGTWKKIV